jgi:hypothetical protein
LIVFRLTEEIKFVRSMIKQERDLAAKRKLKAYLDGIERALEMEFWGPKDSRYDLRHVEDVYRWGKRFMEDVKFRLKGERPGQRGAKRKIR